ncbi:MAG TPA: tryptophan synthase subunit alpha [Polyangiaceae bacterium]|nr:tryptophan synthase subunit alpha [Polyangiaceae bacterium]
MGTDSVGTAGRISKCFTAVKQSGRPVLVAYLCVGDPSLADSEACALAALEAGADILELGVPFSDPTADGAVIAAASFRAIQHEGSLRATLKVAASLRSKTQAPLVLFSYYNPIFTYGDEALVDAAKASGIDAILVVDLPPEEGEALRVRATAQDIAVVPLLAPTSDAERERRAFARASGFIYYVSVTGVTGAATLSANEAGQAAASIRKRANLPVVVGFGIDSAAKAQAIAAQGVDGVVVGTAIVKAVENGKTTAERCANVKELIAGLRQGISGQGISG